MCFYCLKKELTPEQERNKRIVGMAKYYLRRKNRTFQDVATRFDISTTTVGKYFNKILPEVDSILSGKVQTKIALAKAAQIKRFKETIVKKK